MKEKRKREAIVDSDYTEYEESLHDIHSSGYSKLEVRYINFFFSCIFVVSNKVSSLFIDQMFNNVFIILYVGYACMVM